MSCDVRQIPRLKWNATNVFKICLLADIILVLYQNIKNVLFKSPFKCNIFSSMFGCNDGNKVRGIISLYPLQWRSLFCHTVSLDSKRMSCKIYILNLKYLRTDLRNITLHFYVQVYNFNSHIHEHMVSVSEWSLYKCIFASQALDMFLDVSVIHKNIQIYNNVA